jgi:S-adenosylmethionine-diacylglycerol 3-amino-3-carboxypropyl transferase
MSDPKASIADRAAFDFIRYGSVWEDAEVLCEALAPVAKGGRLLSIASAGDNVLALLTLDPAEIVAADLSRAQLACLELRLAAFRLIVDHAALLHFLGVGQPEGAAAARFARYAELRGELSPGAAAFWDAHAEAIAGGVLHAGKFERYLRTFGARVLPLIHSRRTRTDLLRERPLEARRAFYRDRWDSVRWRLMFRLFFSRAVMGRFGRDPAFFTQVEGPVGERILARTRHALAELDPHRNPWLVYIITGAFAAHALPRYLLPEHHATIRERLSRVRVVEGAVEGAGDGRFDGCNLSDVFEYMDPTEHKRCYGALVQRLRPGARLVYWNMLAPRERPDSLERQVRPLDDLAASLHARDRAWFYQRLHVDEVMA